MSKEKQSDLIWDSRYRADKELEKKELRMFDEKQPPAEKR